MSDQSRNGEAAARGKADDLLAALADPSCRSIAADHVAVVVAHPDDETIGCGAQLARLTGATIVVVSDGAPRDLADAVAHGFDSAASYAAARRNELFAALALAGVPRQQVALLGFPDQGVTFALVEIARRLRDLCSRQAISLLITHPYEGGHPDHDATAFATHGARALLARQGHAVSIIETPYYFLGGDGLAVQRFASHDSDGAVVLRLDADARARKQAMITSHVTQRRTLAMFGTDCECFRHAPAYDFASLPNAGRLFYAQQSWGMDGARWLQFSRKAMEELDREIQRCP